MSNLSHSPEYFSSFQGDTGPIGPQGPRGLRGQPVSFLSWQAISGGALCVVGMSCSPESWNCRMARVERDLKDHLVPTLLPWAGTSSTRPGCSQLHSTWPWTLPGRGYPQLLWATCSSVSPPSWWRISS